MSDVPPSEMDAPPILVSEALPTEPESPPLLDKLPMPRFVQAFAAVTCLIFLVALVRTPHAIESGIKAERGRKALAAADSSKAVALLGEVHTEYPQAVDVTLDLIDADIQDGKIQEAINLEESFNGTHVSEEQSGRLDEFEKRLDAIVQAVNDEVAKSGKPGSAGKK